MMRNVLMRNVLAALALVSATSLAAASEMKSQHGGRMAEAGEYHVELVSKADAVEVHLADHDNKAVSSASHKGLAILNIDGKSQRIVLSPAGASRLTGKATSAIQGAPKGVVQITLPNGKTVQARFN